MHASKFHYQVGGVLSLSCVILILGFIGLCKCNIEWILSN